MFNEDRCRSRILFCFGGGAAHPAPAPQPRPQLRPNPPTPPPPPPPPSHTHTQQNFAGGVHSARAGPSEAGDKPPDLQRVLHFPLQRRQRQAREAAPCHSRDVCVFVSVCVCVCESASLCKGRRGLRHTLNPLAWSFTPRVYPTAIAST